MPIAPARPCSRPRCPNLQPCPEHARGETYRETVTARPWRALYKQQRWVRLSARVRAQEPVCLACRAAGRTPQPTRHVDHVTPHRGDLRLFYDRTNLQALCASCHSAKTRREARLRGDTIDASPTVTRRGQGRGDRNPWPDGG